MKRMVRLLAALLALMMVLSGFAGAEEILPIVTFEDETYAYIGKNSAVCVYDKTTGLENIAAYDATVNRLVHETSEFAWFFVAAADGSGSLLRVDKDNERAPETVANDVYADCVYDVVSGKIYYLSQVNENLLMEYDPETNTSARVAQLPAGARVELEKGMNGLYMWIILQGSENERLYRFAKEELKLYQVTLPRAGMYRGFNNFEVLAAEDALYVRAKGSEAFYKADTLRPYGMNEYDAKLYYMYETQDRVLTVIEWDPALTTKRVVCTTQMNEQVNVSFEIVDGVACMIGGSGMMYAVALADGTMTAIEAARGNSAYASLRAVGDRVAVYGARDELAPIDFVALTDLKGEIRPVVTVQPIATPTPTPVPTPAPTPVPAPTSAPSGYTELGMWAKGDAVRDVQRRLNALGYDCGKADGILGNKTSEMLRYFQGDVGLKETGIATVETQKRLFANDAPENNPYRQLKRGSSGIRVKQLQNKLRALGYTCEKTDGEFGRRTETAVKLFQKTMGLSADGIAGQKTLKALYGKGARTYNGYIELRNGDEGTKVMELETRLVKLGYMKKADSTYDNATVKAIKEFQWDNGLDESGIATVETQELLFRNAKPTKTADPKPTKTTEPEPTETTKPEPTETTKPEPTETTEPEPTETTKPEPTETTEPEPTETTEPEPTKTTEPEPTKTTEPEPTKTTEPEPTDPPAPTKKECVKSLLRVLNDKYGEGAYDEASAVEWLQDTLFKLGAVFPHQDGYTSVLTDFVAAWQRDHGIEASKPGLMTKATLRAMLKEIGE